MNSDHMEGCTLNHPPGDRCHLEPCSPRCTDEADCTACGLHNPFGWYLTREGVDAFGSWAQFAITSGVCDPNGVRISARDRIARRLWVRGMRDARGSNWILLATYNANMLNYTIHDSRICGAGYWYVRDVTRVSGQPTVPVLCFYPAHMRSVHHVAIFGYRTASPQLADGPQPEALRI